VLDTLVDPIVASQWVYLLILAVAALDALFPIAPSEATVIAAAALAATGELVLGLVLVSGAAGAIIGDNVAYLVGRVGQRFVLDRVLDSSRGRRRVAIAEAHLRRRGGTIIAVSRFIPGGRTATMLSAGIVGLSWRRFAGFDLVAGVLWASYASLLGWIGGRTFSDEPVHALLLAFGLAGGLLLAIEGGRRAHRALGRRVEP